MCTVYSHHSLLFLCLKFQSNCLFEIMALTFTRFPLFLWVQLPWQPVFCFLSYLSPADSTLPYFFILQHFSVFLSGVHCTKDRWDVNLALSLQKIFVTSKRKKRFNSICSSLSWHYSISNKNNVGTYCQ